MTDVLEELGREDILVVTADASPSSLECVLSGKCLATFSQQLPIQAPMAYEVLYHYNQSQMWPVTPIATGPMIIDASNAEGFKSCGGLRPIGEDAYYDLSPSSRSRLTRSLEGRRRGHVRGRRRSRQTIVAKGRMFRDLGVEEHSQLGSWTERRNRREYCSASCASIGNSPPTAVDTLLRTS